MIQRSELVIPDCGFVDSTITINGRFYITKEGRFPSVTTMLGATADKSFLIEWRKRVGNEAADKKTKHSTDVGTEMHTLLEMYLAGTTHSPADFSSKSIAFYKKIKPLLQSKIATWCHIEIPVFSATYQLAGRVDLLAKTEDGQLIMVDYKSNHNLTRLKKDDEVLDYKLQVTAYCKMFEETYGYKVTQGLILMTNGLTNQHWAFNPDDYVVQLKERIQTYYDNITHI
jgi:CRISPR/Cas system-associated exonuclease Cas4 (RecB family)